MCTLQKSRETESLSSAQELDGQRHLPIARIKMLLNFVGRIGDQDDHADHIA
jgi:hypothetical protein